MANFFVTLAKPALKLIGGTFSSLANRVGHQTFSLGISILACSIRVPKIHRIVCDVSVEIDLVVVSDGVGLQEAAKGGRVDAGLVVVHAKLGDPGLAGVLEAALVGSAGDAVLVIVVGGAQRAVVVEEAGDRAALVGQQKGARCRSDRGADILDDRIVDIVGVDVAAGERAG